MNKIKQIIKRLFPAEQKVLNIFKITYLVLFIISLPEIFIYIGGEAALGIWNTLAWFALWVIFIVFMLALPMYYKSKKRNIVFIPLLIFLIFLYIVAVKAHRYTAGLLDILYFLPVLITFILWNNKSTKPVRNLIIFLAVPFSLVAFDKIVTLGFQLSCPFTTLEAEYNPIYLPKRFFHEENEKLVPNIQEINRIPSFHNLPELNREHTILLYDTCGWVKEKIANDLLKKGNVILCKTRKDDWNEQKYFNTSFQSIIRIKDKNEKIIVAQLYSNLFIKKYEKFWLHYRSKSYCGYGNIFQTQHIHFKNEYKKYIRLSNKGE